jgi:hypothetical protein
MGGYGSGNHGGRPLVEEQLCLDVNRLHRTNRLIRWNGIISWSNNFGEKVGAVTLTSGVDCMTAAGRLNGEPWRQTFNIIWTPCFYGRSRPWFQCPHCSARRCKLYIGQRGLACRLCYGLTNASTREDAEGRLWLKKRKLEAKIIDDGDRYLKPKGMHEKTFDRICSQLNLIEYELLG